MTKEAPNASPVSPEKLTVQQLLGMLTPAQFRACLSSFILLLAGAFGAGAWVNQVRLDLDYRTKRTTAEDTARQTIETVKSKIEADSKARYERLFTEKTAELTKNELQHNQQIEFLSRSYNYMLAHTRAGGSIFESDGAEQIAAKKQLVLLLEQMYKHGKQSEQAREGYKIIETQGSKNHVIQFDDGNTYSIPPGPKQDLIEREWSRPQ